MTLRLKPRSGFHGSVTTAVEVAFYLDAVEDPVLKRGLQGSVLQCRGRANDAREEPMVMRCTTTKRFGMAAGTFSLTLAIPDAYGRTLPPFEDLITDDTWCDITFIVGKQRFHTLRGITSSCFVDETTSGGGTQRRATIEGFDFGKIFDRTPIWFNQFRMEDAFSEALQIFQIPNVAGTPNEAVRRTLYGFLDSQVRADRAGNWQLPGGMPGWQGAFPDTFVFDDSGFDAVSERRIAVSQQFMSPEGQSAWALASEWSDPAFCELYCDLITKGAPQNGSIGEAETPATLQGRKSGGLLDPDRSYDVNDTLMGVIFRDRPFVRSDLGTQSAWYGLPTVEVIPEELSSRRLGRSGQERFNAYFVSPRALQSAGVLQSLVGPLWDPADIAKHGLRQFSVDSRYLSEQSDLFTLTEALRARARDFHCLNPYFFTGSLKFARWRPDIRIGQRMRIRESTPEQDVWCYVEAVTQHWSGGGTGGRTEVEVTRGWRGTNESLLGAVSEAASRYEFLPGHNALAVGGTAPSVPGLSFYGTGRGVQP